MLAGYEKRIKPSTRGIFTFGEKNATSIWGRKSSREFPRSAAAKLRNMVNLLEAE
jgi:predicted Rdx family selenoprotein